MHTTNRRAGVSSALSPALSPFRLGIAAAVLGLCAALTGCFGTSSSDGGGISCPDGTADSLCLSRAALADTGEVIFVGYCTGCHNPGGVGDPSGAPPLANSDFFMANKRRTIEILLAGTTDSLFVNGLWYTGNMPAWSGTFTDLEIAGILTYIRTVLNDSTVVSCNSDEITEEGWATCQKKRRSLSQRNKDFVNVWEVKEVRDSLDALPHP